MAVPTNSSKIQLGLSQFPEGVPNEIFNQIFQIYQACRNLANYVSQYSGVDEYSQDLWSQLGIDETIYPGNPTRWYVKQNEALNFGQIVAPINVAGVVQARLANATNNTRWACGIVSSSDHVPAIGEFCEVTIGSGRIEGISGLTPGSRYWLNTVNGQVINAPAVAAGNIEQFVGWALSSNRLVVNISGNYVQH